MFSPLLLMSLAASLASSGAQIQLVTDGEPYTFFAITDDVVRFSVRAAADARIVLATQPALSALSVIEVFLGDSGNVRSILRENQTLPNKAEALTPLLLSPSEARAFTLTWGRGDIRVSRAGAPAPLLSWRNPRPEEYNYVGFATPRGTRGDWLLRGVKNLLDGRYSYTPVAAAGSLTFRLLEARMASIILTASPSSSNPKIEVIFGPTMSFGIRRDGRVPNQAEATGDFIDESTVLRVTWGPAGVALGRAGEPAFLSWKDPEPFNISQVGLSRGTQSWIVHAPPPDQGIVSVALSDRFWARGLPMTQRCAVDGGHDAAGTVHYVGRARHESGWLPGRIPLWYGTNLVVSWNGNEINKGEHEVLANCDAKWVNGTAATLPLNSLPAGVGPTGEIVFICRARREGWVVIGRYLRSEGVCKINWGATENSFPIFDVLVLPPPPRTLSAI